MRLQRCTTNCGGFLSWSGTLLAPECIVPHPQLFREVFAVKIAIWGVISPPPQVGHATFAAARSATGRTTSKLFLQRSHMNVYVGIGFLPAGLPAFASRAKRVWI